MKNTLIVLSALATLGLVVDISQSSSPNVPRWSLLLVLAVSLSLMAYYRWHFDQAVQLRNEMQDQLVRLLPKYMARDAKPAQDGDGQPEVRSWPEPRPKTSRDVGAGGDDDLIQQADLIEEPSDETLPPNDWSSGATQNS